MKGGIISSMNLNQKNLSLIINIATSSDGNLNYHAVKCEKFPWHILLIQYLRCAVHQVALREVGAQVAAAVAASEARDGAIAVALVRPEHERRGDGQQRREAILAQSAAALRLRREHTVLHVRARAARVLLAAARGHVRNVQVAESNERTALAHVDDLWPGYIG